MPYYDKSEDWLHQSSLLLEARRTTTRVTTKYHIKSAHRRTKKEMDVDSTAPSTTTATKPPRGHLVLKTYDPVSGVTLKYKTSKAAEVSRLVQMLGGLGRCMAALPPKAVEDAAVAADAPGDVGGEGSGAQTPVPRAGTPAGAAQGQAQQGQGQQGGGGGKGKKKKGKR